MTYGMQIAPSLMGRKAIKGMHGLHPDYPGSKAMICSNLTLPSLARIGKIFGLMSECTALQPPTGHATR